MRKEIGKVRSTFFGIGDRGLLTFMIDFDFEGGTTQGFGNYQLDTWSEDLNRRVGTAHGLDVYLQLCHVFGVDELHKAKGKTVWVLRDDDRPGDLITGIRSLAFDMDAGGREFTIAAWKKEWKL